MFDATELEEWLLKISKFVNRKIAIYLIGGCAMSFKLLKPATKDVDIVTLNKRDFNMLDTAILRAGYKKETDLDEFYLTAMSVYMKDDSRIDVFVKEVAKMLSFTGSMQKRAVLFKKFNLLEVYLSSNEDIWLFKAVTPRPDDIKDCMALMQQPLDFNAILDEVKHQDSKYLSLYFPVYEKVCEIENTSGTAITIKNDLWNNVESRWSNRPSDFMADVKYQERHIPNKRLRIDLKK